MAQSIKLANNTYWDWTGLAVDYEDVTVTCGTTRYHTLYYGDATPIKATRDKTVGAYVYSVVNDRPVFFIWVRNTTLRIFAPTESTQVTIRIYYKLP